MSTDVAERPSGVSIDVQEKVFVSGNLAGLKPGERLAYYQSLCRSLALNPLTRPFEYIELDGELTLYATRNCTDQLRESRDIDLHIVSRELVEDVFVVTARAKMKPGRQDESIGAVPMAKEEGEWKTSANNKRYFVGAGTFKRLAPSDRANAMMKAETKAKRRVTLSICGLGMVDESELETIRNKRKVIVDEAGEIRTYGPPPEAERPAFAASAEAQAPEAVPVSEPPADTATPAPEKTIEDYCASLRTAHDTKAVNALWATVPSPLRDACSRTYTDTLKALKGR